MPMRLVIAGTANIADKAVVTSKIDDLAVTAPKLVPVTGNKIADDQVSLEHIAPTTVKELALMAKVSEVTIEVRANEKHSLEDVETR